jgi:outer membrane immunogenic protein
LASSLGSDNIDLDGGLAGGQIGVNWQTGHWVLGIEADYQWANIDGDAPTIGGLTGSAEVKRFGTVRGRLGYASDRWMLYGTGGWAFGARATASTTGLINVNDSHTLDGWTAGVGVEYAFAPNWSTKVEYLHVNLDEKAFFTGTFAFCSIAPSTCTAGADIDLVRVGINYRFAPLP